jgi:membrane protease YdiL (CAAX protease family)
MKSLAIRYPFLFGILVSLVAIFGQMWPLWLPGLTQEVQILAARATDVVIAVFLLSWLKWWKDAGFTRIRSWKTLFPYLPLILLVLLGYASLIGSTGIKVKDPILILLGALSFLAGGFVEEALFRGVVLRAFLPRRLLKAAALSSLVFALAHLPNLLVGQELGATGLQLVRSFLVGFAFVAPLAYTRNIWPLVLLHGLMNFSSFLSSGRLTLIATESPKIEQMISEIVIFGLMAAYGYWLLRRGENKPQMTYPVPNAV